MAYTYIEAVGIGFPTVRCHATGLGTLYSDLVWDGGTSLPSQQTLDDWIAANPETIGVNLTKYEFRKLFTMSERVAIDNSPSNTNIPSNYRAILVTMFKDLEVSGVVEMDNPDVIAGVNLLESLGLIGTGRAAQVLANQQP